MASPAEIAQGLPETLPEDFGEWDSESSPATVPGSSGGLDATRGLGDVLKPPAPTPEPEVKEVAPAPAGDRLRGAALPSPAGVHAHDGPLLHRQKSSALVAAMVPNSVSNGKEAAHPTHEVPFPPPRPKVPVSDRPSEVMGVPARATSDADEFLESLRPKIAATMDEKNTKKKWIIVAAVSICSILVLAILAIRLFIPGTPSTMKKAGEPGPAANETQLKNNTPKPSPSAPLTQDKLPTATQTQQTPESQPTETKEEDTPPEVQSKLMNDQLTAPTRIPRDIKKPANESEPPSVGFGTTGAETLGGSSAIPSVFAGEARPIVHPAPSALTISAGVAVGLLTQKTTPSYPAIAKAARVSGTVEIQATITKTGTIKDLRVVSGPVMLRQAALDAVQTWRYKPYRLNNEPTEVQTTINVIFSLGQ